MTAQAFANAALISKWRLSDHMAGTPKDASPELLRRVRAAVAYTDKPQTEIAEALDISERTFERWKGGEGIQRPRVNLPIIAGACGIPEAFFYADLSRLEELVPSDAASRLDDAVAGLAQTARQAEPVPKRRAND